MVGRKAVATANKVVVQLDNEKVVLTADLMVFLRVGLMELLMVVLWAVAKVADTAAMMAK